MDFSMGLVSAILTSVVFLPFFYIAYLGKQESNKKNKIFQREALRLGFRLDEKEHWGNTFIGLDRTLSKLVYMRYTPEELKKLEVPLDSIKNCEILIQQSKGRIQQKVDLNLVKVDLILNLVDAEERKIILNFFDREDLVAQDLEVERAERWKKLIMKFHSSIKPMRSAS